ncbi:uncharacterized protein LOC134855869 [Symsagittifera roscoffensis]|uniref:uncharacterized protein LOC134855869 n=1 Tax=Symsagittifera roscoffensis TaxID=84072 RepID=UPI00307B91C6
MSSLKASVLPKLVTLPSEWDLDDDLENEISRLAETTSSPIKAINGQRCEGDEDSDEDQFLKSVDLFVKKDFNTSLNSNNDSIVESGGSKSSNTAERVTEKSAIEEALCAIEEREKSQDPICESSEDSEIDVDAKSWMRKPNSEKSGMAPKDVKFIWSSTVVKDKSLKGPVSQTSWSPKKPKKVDQANRILEEYGSSPQSQHRVVAMMKAQQLALSEHNSVSGHANRDCQLIANQCIELGNEVRAI